MSLELDVTNIKSIVEKDELFKAASEENLSNRESEVAKNRSAFVNTLPKVRLFAFIPDQLNTRVEEVPGNFRYDPEEDKYYDEIYKEWTLEGLETAYRTHRSPFGENVTIVGRGWLENLANEINNMINYSSKPW